MTQCQIIYRFNTQMLALIGTCPFCENRQRWTDEELLVTLQLCFVTGWKCARYRSDTAAEKQTETKSLTKRMAAARVHKRALYAFWCNKPLFRLAGPLSNRQRKSWHLFSIGKKNIYFIPNGFKKPLHDELYIYCNCTLRSHKFLQCFPSWKLQ